MISVGHTTRIPVNVWWQTTLIRKTQRTLRRKPPARGAESVVWARPGLALTAVAVAARSLRLDRSLQVKSSLEESVQPEMVGLNGGSLCSARVLSGSAQRARYLPTTVSRLVPAGLVLPRRR